MKVLYPMFVLALSALFVPVSHGQWALDSDNSQVSFVSVKNETVSETHRFQVLKGAVTPFGRANIEISLGSVETGIPIRNDRMKSMLFNTAEFARATITAAVDIRELMKLDAGGSATMDLSMQVDLHGISRPLTAAVKVTRTSDTAWRVSTASPVAVDAVEFALDAGIEALRNVAGLKSISTAVPVSFDLVFVKQ
jgi:polyisoprenoid-binding protein YceI